MGRRVGQDKVILLLSDAPSGEIIQPTPWWKPAVIDSQIPLRDDLTFFVTHGDITGRVCTFIFMLLLLALGVRFLTRR